MNMESTLRNEIESGFEDIKRIEIGTKQYTDAVDSLVKLVDRAIKIDEINADFDAKADNRESDIEFKNKQLAEEKRDRKVRNSIAIAGLVTSTALAVWGTLKTFKFDDAGGIISSTMGRDFIHNLLPRK